MIRCVFSMPFAYALWLTVAAMACGGCQSVFAQTSARGVATPHLVFSTYLGGSTACADCSDVRTYAQNAASDAWGDTYVTGATKVSDLAAPFACQGKPAAHSKLSAFVVKYEPMAGFCGAPTWAAISNLWGSESRSCPMAGSPSAE